MHRGMTELIRFRSCDFVSLGGSRPNKVGTQAVVDGAAVIRFWHASGRIEKRVISSIQILCVISHEVWHNHADSALFVIEHNRRATSFARAKFQRPIRVVSVEGLTVQAVDVVDVQVSMVEEDDMRRSLPCDALAYGAVAGVIVYRVFI